MSDGRRVRLSASDLTKLGLALGVLVALVVVASRPEVAKLVDPTRVQGWLAQAGPFAPLVLMGLMATAVIVTPIPSLPLDLAAGAFFGPLRGTLYTVTGALVGAAVCFAVARYLGGSLVERFAKGHILVCNQCSDRLLTKVVFFARLLPVISFDVVSYAAGLTKMSATKFLAATALGMLPPTFLFNALGKSALLDTRLALFAGAAMATLFFLLPRWIEKYNLFGLKRFFGHPEAVA